MIDRKAAKKDQDDEERSVPQVVGIDLAGMEAEGSHENLIPILAA